MFEPEQEKRRKNIKPLLSLKGLYGEQHAILYTLFRTFPMLLM